MNNTTSEVLWNDNLKLIVSDVDETVADLFVPAKEAMAEELNHLLEEGRVLFFVSGAGFVSIKKRIVDLLNPEFRKHVLVSHCSGAEVLGFDEKGDVLENPYYSKYDQTLTSEQKITWRKIVQQIIEEFHLETHPPIPVKEFKKRYSDNPLAVMFDDRGSQITFEFVNAYNLRTEQIDQLRGHFPDFDMSDLRVPVMERVGQLLEHASIPVTPRLGGMFALDLALKGVSKTTSVRFVLENPEILASLGLTSEEVQNPESIEVWGDKFSVINGGTDRHMSEALPKTVRSIDFRQENPEEFMPGYTTVLWPGEKQLHNGLLEYLQARKNT